MKSFTTLSNLYQSLTQNTTAANVTLGNQMINDTHRYLLQKFFNNETSYSIATAGSQTQTLTTTATLSAGATTATLTSPWAGSSATLSTTFSDGEIYPVVYTASSTAISWSNPLTSNQTSANLTLGYITLTGTLSAAATTATLTTAWTGNTTTIQVTFTSGDIRMAFFETGKTAINWSQPLSQSTNANIQIGSQQFYPAPPNYSKMKTVTITIGVLKWTLTEVLTRREWDQLNVFPYYADIPVNFFIYPGGDHGGQIGIWPIPSTTGNTLTMNYKFRVPDLSISDYSTGTVSVNNGSTAVTASDTALFPTTTNIQTEARWLQIPQSAGGDQQWYQVVSAINGMSMTLYQPYQGTNVSTVAYTLGQMPLINEDFHDLLAYRPLMIYFSSINKDIDKAKQFRELYEEGEVRLAEYSGSNTIDVNLGRRPSQLNPNLFPQNIGNPPN